MTNSSPSAITGPPEPLIDPPLPARPFVPWYGRTVSYCHITWPVALAYARTRPSLRALADGLGVTGRAATVVIDGLERAGLATRRTDPDDRRSVLVELTDQGRAHIDDVRVVQRRLADEFTAPLGDDERTTLLALLRRVHVGARRGAGLVAFGRTDT